MRHSRNNRMVTFTTYPPTLSNEIQLVTNFRPGKGNSDTPDSFVTLQNNRTWLLGELKLDDMDNVRLLVDGAPIYRSM
jgi:hypothetical protein